MIGQEGKRQYVLIKDYNTFMWSYITSRKKTFCWYCLQAFSSEGILKSRIKDCCKINGKQRTIMLKKGEYVKFKNSERQIKSPFIVYADEKAF